MFSVWKLGKETKKGKIIARGVLKPYYCSCGTLLFSARSRPVGLQVKCPTCHKTTLY